MSLRYCLVWWILAAVVTVVMCCGTRAKSATQLYVQTLLAQQAKMSQAIEEQAAVISSLEGA